jgi:UDP-2,3-diacylglucosamine pyrophosphatase LpxH
VKFDTIAREWRFKWSADSDKKSLVEAQNVLDSVLKEVKAVKGVKSVQRVVCGGTHSD